MFTFWPALFLCTRRSWEGLHDPASRSSPPVEPAILAASRAFQHQQERLARASGFPHYVQFFTLLRSKEVIGTPLAVGRLLRVAELVGFPADEIFLDEPRDALAKQLAAVWPDTSADDAREVSR